MATEEWVKRAIENSKTYEELPPRVRIVLPVAEWKAKYDGRQISFDWVNRVRPVVSDCLECHAGSKSIAFNGVLAGRRA